jgi:hypothetical protein
MPGYFFLLLLLLPFFFPLVGFFFAGLVLVGFDV